MNILIITHADFERPGCIDTWADRQEHIITEICPYQGESLVDVTDYDLLLVMGGPQSPLNLKDAPYLANEIILIRQALAQDKPVLGICLGAQLIAEALGAKTEPSLYREVGVLPLTLLPEAAFDPIFQDFTTPLPAMHWHSDMPGLPEGAVVLAKTAGCERQVIRFRDNVYGLQCHFELSRELVAGMVQHCPTDLHHFGPYVKSAAEIMDVSEEAYLRMNRVLFKLLDYFSDLTEVKVESELAHQELHLMHGEL